MGGVSIIQEALKKAQVDYLSNKAPANIKSTASSGQKISLPKIDLFKKITLPKIDIASKVRPAPTPKTKMSITILSISVVSILLISVLGLKVFLTYKGEPLSKEAPSAPLAEVVAPKTFVKPEPEPVAPPPKPVLPPAPTFILNGIMYLDNKPQAIINGYILEVGDSLNGATVMLIDKDYVLLDMKEDKLRLNLKHN
jgi:hypothetical protein